MSPEQNKEPITVYDFYEYSADKLWIGTNEGLMIRHKDGSISKQKIFYKNQPLAVTKFYKDEDGTFYIGTNYSLFKLDPVNFSVSLLPGTEDDKVMNKIIDSRIVSIAKYHINDDPVLLAVPYGHYLAWYNLRTGKWISRRDTTINIIERMNLKDNLIRRIYQTRDGHIWLATVKEGLGFWKTNGLPNTQFYNHRISEPNSIANNNIYDVKEDGQGILWVSTYGGGLQRFDRNKSTFSHITSSNNLTEGLEIDNNGKIWLISNGHINKYDPVMQTYTRYELPDLEKTGGVQGIIFKNREGKLYVSGKNYFIDFYPDSIATETSTPQVHFTNFSIFNNSFSHLLFNGKIKLNHKDNYFSIEFAAPDYKAPVYYSYMLEGFDKEWIDAGERTYASYLNLEGGDYIFKVRASNSPGSWGEKYNLLEIEIIPPYWKRWWFYLICAFLLAAIVYSVYRYRINELVKRQEIRNRIAQDLHDNVGSTLSSISVYSQVAKIYNQQEKKEELKDALEKIGTTSSEMISELNDTVWAINPRNDNMDVILQRMDSLAKPLMAAQGIQFHFEHDRHLHTLNLDMEKRKNFYLVFKEAINNVVKYSRCKNLYVTVRQEGKTIKLNMIDDGQGFDLEKSSKGYKSSDVYGGGNGLKNMQLRAGQMRGTLKIATSPGKGCHIELVFPIP